MLQLRESRSSSWRSSTGACLATVVHVVFASATAVPSALPVEEELDLTAVHQLLARTGCRRTSRLEKCYLLFVDDGCVTCSLWSSTMTTDVDGDHCSLRSVLDCVRCARSGCASLGSSWTTTLCVTGTRDAQGRVAVQASGGGGNRIVLHSGKLPVSASASASHHH